AVHIGNLTIASIQSLEFQLSGGIEVLPVSKTYIGELSFTICEDQIQMFVLIDIRDADHVGSASRKSRTPLRPEPIGPSPVDMRRHILFALDFVTRHNKVGPIVAVQVGNGYGRARQRGHFSKFLPLISLSGA